MTYRSDKMKDNSYYKESLIFQFCLLFLSPPYHFWMPIHIFSSEEFLFVQIFLVRDQIQEKNSKNWMFQNSVFAQRHLVPSPKLPILESSDHVAALIFCFVIFFIFLKLLFFYLYEESK